MKERKTTTLLTCRARCGSSRRLDKEEEERRERDKAAANRRTVWAEHETLSNSHPQEERKERDRRDAEARTPLFLAQSEGKPG